MLYYCKKCRIIYGYYQQEIRKNEFVEILVSSTERKFMEFREEEADEDTNTYCAEDCSHGDGKLIDVSKLVGDDFEFVWGLLNEHGNKSIKVDKLNAAEIVKINNILKITIQGV